MLVEHSPSRWAQAPGEPRHVPDHAVLGDALLFLGMFYLGWLWPLY